MNATTRSGQVVLTLPVTKVCKKCQVEKPVSDFYIARANADGLNTKCRACYNADNRARDLQKRTSLSETTDSVPATKVCAKCKVEQTMEEFSLRPKGKYGRHPRCKKCVARRHAEWVKANRERLAGRAQATLSTEKNRVCCRCQQSKPLGQFYINLTHKDGLTSKCRTCYQACWQSYSQQNKARIREKDRQYRDANRAVINLRRRESYHTTPYTWKDRDRALRRSGISIDVADRSERIADRTSDDPFEAVFARQLKSWLRKSLSPQEQAFVRAFAENGLDMDAACAECDVPYGVAKKLLAGVQQRARASFPDLPTMWRAA